MVLIFDSDFNISNQHFFFQNQYFIFFFKRHLLVQFDFPATTASFEMYRLYLSLFSDPKKSIKNFVHKFFPVICFNENRFSFWRGQNIFKWVFHYLSCFAFRRNCPVKPYFLQTIITTNLNRCLWLFGGL